MLYYKIQYLLFLFPCIKIRHHGRRGLEGKGICPDEYFDRLEQMELPEQVRLLIDRYVSKQNALDSRYGMYAYLLGFSDCKAMFLGKCLPMEIKEMHTEL